MEIYVIECYIDRLKISAVLEYKVIVLMNLIEIWTRKTKLHYTCG